MKNNRQALAAMFLLGLFSETHVNIVGFIAISELFVFLVAPLIFMVDYHLLRRDGFMPVIILSVLSCIGCVISSIHNNTPLPLLYRGFASAYSLFAIPVVMHHFLRKDLNGLKWYLIGAAISSVITIFALRNGVEAQAIEKTGQWELSFLAHWGATLSLPLQAFYLQCPTLITVIFFLIPPIWTIVTTTTGRSSILTASITLFLVLFVRRRWRNISKLKAHVFMIGMVGFFIAISLSSGYKLAAQRGLLNERAQNKYETQVKTGGSPLALLMAGRGEFFIGLLAAFDEPFWGHGPWALDKKGYYQDFLKRYGDEEDFRKYNEGQIYMARVYGGTGYNRLPVHSMIVGNWVYFGILGLPYWIYILIKIFSVLRRYLDAVPQWFGVLANMIPGLVWNIFFSPLGGRTSLGLYITIIMLVTAVGRRLIPLPEDMCFEAMKYDR